MFEPTLVIAGLGLIIGPPVLACRAVFRFPHMAKLAGVVLAMWQQIVFGFPTMLVLTDIADLPRLPGPKALDSNGIVLAWLVVIIIYSIVSLWLWLQYGLECTQAPSQLNHHTDWHLNADQ
jgi:hypothetical protein